MLLSALKSAKKCNFFKDVALFGPKANINIFQRKFQWSGHEEGTHTCAVKNFLFQKMLILVFATSCVLLCTTIFPFLEYCVMFCIKLINHLLKKYLQLSFKYCAGTIFF